MSDFTTVSIRPETKQKMDAHRPEGSTWDEFFNKAFEDIDNPTDEELEHAISVFATVVDRAGEDGAGFEREALERLSEAGFYGGGSQ